MKKFLLVTNLISLALLAAFILRIHDVQSKATSMHERQQNVSTCNRCTEKIITISLNEDEYFRFYDFFSDTVVFHFTSGVQKSILQEEKELDFGQILGNT
jgi:hypothetical protein